MHNNVRRSQTAAFAACLPPASFVQTVDICNSDDDDDDDDDDDKLMQWRWSDGDAMLEWRLPFDVSGSVYRRDAVQNIVNGEDFSFLSKAVVVLFFVVCSYVCMLFSISLSVALNSTTNRSAHVVWR